MERNCHFAIPSGLSPPDFSAIKMDKEDEDQVPNQHDEIIELPLSWMSPMLNLNSTPLKRGDDRPIIPVAKKLNFNE